MGSVEVVHKQGRVAEIHGLDPFASSAVDTPEVWVCKPTDTAVVLGSSQHSSLLDPERCTEAGVEVTRRRSGGAAVLVDTAMVHWVDLILPNGLVPDDVRGSMEMFGEIWFAALGLDASRFGVHRGGMLKTPWSDLVCFDGVGPGEVVRHSDGRKLVGLSQRRTRRGVRVQGMVHTAPLMYRMERLFGVDVPNRPLLEPATVDIDADDLAKGLSSQLTQL